MSVKFTINNENLGTFVVDEAAFKSRFEELHTIVGSIKDKDKDLKKAAKQLKALVLKEPLFLRGQAILGEMYLDLDDEAETQKTHISGAKAALKLIPKDFQGPLDMDNPDAQCFMRCHASYAESFAAQGDYKKALAETRRHLAFDPEDMFDRGRDFGELAIMAGEAAEAETVLNERVEEMPTANYSLGYLAFERGEFAKAITTLRRAFVLAPYTVDFLTGRLIAPNIFWEQGPNEVDYHENMAYVELLGGEMWTANQAAREFLEWLSQTSLALSERAAMARVSENCMLAEDGEAMEAAVRDWAELLAGINEKTSARLVQKVDDPEDGESMYPWELYSRAQERMLSEDEEFEGDEEHGEGCGCGCGH